VQGRGVRALGEGQDISIHCVSASIKLGNRQFSLAVLSRLFELLLRGIWITHSKTSRWIFGHVKAAIFLFEKLRLALDSMLSATGRSLRGSLDRAMEQVGLRQISSFGVGAVLAPQTGVETIRLVLSHAGLVETGLAFLPSLRLPVQFCGPDFLINRNSFHKLGSCETRGNG